MDVVGRDADLLPPLVGIGASAGGLEALRDMLGAARATTPLAFAVVQHLDPHHESMLADLLQRHTELRVRQAEGGEIPAAGEVYIIPPGVGLGVEGGALQLRPFVQPRGFRRPIDDFFEELGRDRGLRSACVILSGTGADGTIGLRSVKEHGGLCVVQDPATAKYDGMPVSAIGTGLVDFIRGSAEMVATLERFFTADGAAGPRDEVGERIEDLCQTLRHAVGHDFAGYKRTTLERRIKRRMNVLGITAASAYLQRVRTDQAECGALFRDLLINVTRFFRDPELFALLRSEVIDKLAEEADGTEDVRIWVAGCSSGEEAYSIAMMMFAALRARGKPLNVQIFATDIDEKMLEIAREGRYPLSALADIPEAYHTDFTICGDGAFQIVPALRNAIRFSAHSVVKDPPFSRIDFISCRNLLIYFGDRLQQAVLPIFHYALKPDGYLFLGPSESVGRLDEVFTAMDARARLFRRRDGRPAYVIDSTLPPGVRPRGDVARLKSGTELALQAEPLATRRVIERYAPPSMVVSLDGEVITSHGRLSKYFEFPTGGARALFAGTHARPGLREYLMPLVREATRSHARVAARDVTALSEFGAQKLEIIADPLPDNTVLLVFRDTAPFAQERDSELAELGPPESQTQFLEDELRLTRHRLRTAIEELETANEELKSSNEEMMSMNEELQSTNEELTTVNDELKSKIEQLVVANDDLTNFFQSTDLAMLVLDRNKRIRNFSAAATSVFPLSAHDIGRPLDEISSRLKDDTVLRDARAVLEEGVPVIRDVKTRDGARAWSMRATPYRAGSGEIAGVSLVFTDITESTRLTAELRTERQRLEMAVTVARIGVWDYNTATGAMVIDATQAELLDFPAGEPVPVDSLMSRVDGQDRPALETSLRDTIAGRADFDASFRVNHRDGRVLWLRGLGRQIFADGAMHIIGVMFDVTGDRELAETRELMLRELNHRVKNLFAVIASIVSGAARSAGNVRDLADAVRDRISALGRSHSLTQASYAANPPTLADLLGVVLAPYRGNADVSVTGPEVRIRTESVTPLTLVLHEWATNSCKYGALGNRQARLAVSWEIRADGALEIFWHEDGLEPMRTTEPLRTGFGTRLIEVSAQQLGGSQTQSKAEGSFRARLRIAAAARAQ